MNICMIYQGGFPPHERIEKEAQTLIKKGHKIILLCNNYGNFDKNEDFYEGIKIIRLKPNWFKKQKINKIIKFPVFLNPVWVFQIFSAIKKFDIDVLHVNDLPLALAAIFWGKICKIPVIFDMYENYPEALKGWCMIDWKYFVFKNYKLAEVAQKLSEKYADYIITVVEEFKDLLIARGIPQDKIFVISNTVDLESFLNFSIKETILIDKYKNNYIVFYVGAINIERGLDEIIKSLKYVIKEIPEVKLVIAGKGYLGYDEYLKKLAQNEGVSDYVDFIEWIPFQEIPSYIKKCDLCLVPHVNNDFINTTIPNKIFQYMALSKPILVSNAKPLKRVVEEANCGFVFEGGNIQDIASKIITAKKADSNLLGQNGKLLVEKKYNWNETEKVLISLYDHVKNRIKKDKDDGTKR